VDASEHHLEEARSEAELAQRNLQACAWNAVVNYRSERATKKMGDLIRAVNWHHRAVGRVKLLELVEAGVIEEFEPCPDRCCIRPGGLFHAEGCENDYNSDVSKYRRERAVEMLPGGSDGHAGYRAADVSLVGGAFG
jgi:hypothetical protein